MKAHGGVDVSGARQGNLTVSKLVPTYKRQV
jgi:hypothetical protein